MQRLAPRHLPVLLLVLSAGRGWGVDVPFSTGQIIDGDFGGSISVHAADVDGDGDLDVLGAAITADDITWWENLDGTGTIWTTHTIEGDFEGAASVHAADVDGDGDLDVLGAASYAGDITWWENLNGAGTSWATHTIEGSFTGAISVSAADVDGDGDFDILGAATTADDIAWWENPGGAATTDGTPWTAHTIDGDFDGVYSALGRDIDGDGDLDVLGAAISADDVTWWENVNGVGTSWTAHTIDAEFNGAVSADAADVDGDGDLDVLGAGYFAGEIAWWENLNGAGTSWTKHTLDGSFGGANSVHAADLDGDGDLDVLGAGRTADQVKWWENHIGTGANWTAHTVDAAFDGALSVKAADIDGDGDLDVLGAADISNDITWWGNKTIHRSAVFPTKHPISGYFGDAIFVHIADMDGDGDVDVLGSEDFSGAVLWWENLDGSGTIWTGHAVATIWNGVLWLDTADVDSDGDLDVVVPASGHSTGYVAWYENADGMGTMWTTHMIDEPIEAPGAVDAADMDGDGDVDVVGAAFGTAEILWWENVNGAGTTWSAHPIKSDFYGPSSVQAADMDRDGDLDVLATANSADDVVWWENVNGLGTSWTEHMLADNFDSASAAYAADLDGDGDLDVVAVSNNYDGVNWWENLNGAGTSWAAHSIENGVDLFQSVHAGDLDQDGDLDILATAYYKDDIRWWENADGSGTTWTPHLIVGDFDGARTAASADVDGDGDLDVLGAGKFADQIAWWENRGGQFALPTSSVAVSPLTVPVNTAVLAIDATHKGRAGDTDVELATFELLFDDGATPLTNVEANNTIDNLTVYRDDGSGTFNPLADTLVLTVGSLSLTAGVQQVSFADGNPDAQVIFGTPQRYFVVLDLVSAGLVNRFRVIHLTEFSSTAEDRDYDIPLKLEYSLNTPTRVMELIAGPGADCPPDLVRANQALSGTQTLKATSTATLGPNLIVSGDDIAVHAPVVSILSDTTIYGPFTVGNNPACP